MTRFPTREEERIWFSRCWVTSRCRPCRHEPNGIIRFRLVPTGSENIFHIWCGELFIDPMIGVDGELHWIRPQKGRCRGEHLNLRSLNIDLHEIRYAVTRARID